MLLIILLLLFRLSDSFIFISLVDRSRLHYARIVNDDNRDISEMDIHLNNELERLLKIIPIHSKNESEIIEDSFEGYLREEFKILCDGKKKIDFEKYYVWKKEKGTFLERDELLEIFNKITDVYNECDLMEFIEITRIIDDKYEY